jgi:DNA-directed RNA polymerase alpha subunit
MNTKEFVHKVLLELKTGLDDASRSGCSIPAFNCRIEFSLADGADAVKFTVPFHFRGSKKIWEELRKDTLKVEPEVEPESICITLRTPVNECGFSTRVLHALRRGQINTISDLVKQSYTDLLGLRNLGHVSVSEIENFLNDHGLYLRDDSEKSINTSIN